MAASSNWREYLERLVPGWLLGPVAERFVGALGLTQDAIFQGIEEATKASWLLEDTSPEDALPLAGEDSHMPRFAGSGLYGAPSGETSANYRVRLVARWNVWSYAGTETGLEGLLVALGYPNASVVPNRDFSIDGDYTNWSRFVVIIPVTDHGWGDPGDWGDVGRTWGDGQVWGNTAAAIDVNALRLLIARYKAAHEICSGIIALRSGNVWGDPDLAWDGLGLTWGSGGDPPIIWSAR